MRNQPPFKYFHVLSKIKDVTTKDFDLRNVYKITSQKNTPTHRFSRHLEKKTQQKKIDTKKNSKARGEKRGRIQVSTKENKQQKKKRKI